MSEMAIAELRILYKYADLLHDHCDGARTTVKNCAKNRYHFIPDELGALVEPSGAAVDLSNIRLIQFLKAIHNDVKSLNTNNIEDSLSELGSYAFPREFGGVTVQVGEERERKRAKIDEAHRRARVLSHVYGGPDESVPTLTVEDIMRSEYDLNALQEYNALQISLDHHSVSTEALASVGRFIHEFYVSQTGSKNVTNYNVFCDAAPNVVKFMKEVPSFTQIFTAQTVLDSAPSGRELLGERVALYVGAADESGVEHVYDTDGLTNRTAGLGRANRVVVPRLLKLQRSLQTLGLAWHPLWNSCM
jgi:hypothetical protein